MKLELLMLLTTAVLPTAAATCDELSKLALPNVSIGKVESVAAGSFTPPGGPEITGMPAFCRVAGSIQPASDSDIQFEVWLPSSNWNGKFQGIGNGGFAGSIGFSFMATAVQNGYATASTDTGHHGSAIDASWALGHPEKIVDFGYRSIHEMTETAKALVRTFYGAAPRRSYFASCSNGGRQALMEAQRYPADYDGLIAGAPANYWSHLLTGAVWDMQATLADSASYIPAAKLPAIEAAVVESCDAMDGVKDGVIDNPPACHFDPSKLLCKGAESDSCLTAPQLAALQKIYAGPRDSKGKQIFPGYSVGGETGGGGWGTWLFGNAPGKALMVSFGNGFFKNMVFGDTWDFKTFNFDRDTKIADDKAGPLLNATNPDLSAFRKRGGKLILYHGWNDPAIPAVNSVNYYQSVVSKMGAKETASFVRLFMVPGMQHCGGGPGPNVFNQGGAPHGDAEHDMGRALERWVEDNVAPEQIIAIKYKGANPSSGVLRTRPLCAYPKVARWTGAGSTDDAANFVCTDAAKAQPKSK